MARAALALLIIGYASCMDVREVVERRVMVRTIGSDLQPAATGYIYKKDNDGPASVSQMDHGEVMEHLAKLYEKPESYVAPIPLLAGPFYSKEEDADKSASDADKKIIPVVEDQGGKKDDHALDGIAHEEYEKILAAYQKDFDEYLKKMELNNQEHGYGSYGHHGQDEKDDEGHKKAYHFAKGVAGKYGSEKNEGYGSDDERGHKKDYDGADYFDEHYKREHEDGGFGKKDLYGRGKGVTGFHKSFDTNAYSKDHDENDRKSVQDGVNKYGNIHGHPGTVFKDFNKEDSYDAGYGSKESEEHDRPEYEGESPLYSDGGIAVKSGEYDDKGYSFKVKH